MKELSDATFNEHTTIHRTPEPIGEVPQLGRVVAGETPDYTQPSEGPSLIVPPSSRTGEAASSAAELPDATSRAAAHAAINAEGPVRPGDGGKPPIDQPPTAQGGFESEDPSEHTRQLESVFTRLKEINDMPDGEGQVDALTTDPSLQRLGLGVHNREILDDVRVAVQDAALLATALKTVYIQTSGKQITQGLNATLKDFIYTLPDAVLATRPGALQETGYTGDPLGNVVSPTPALAREITEILGNSDDLNPELSRLGVDAALVGKLEWAAWLEKADLLAEGSVAKVIGCYQPEAGILPGDEPQPYWIDEPGGQWVQWQAPEQWQGLWNMLDRARTKGEAGAAFVDELQREMRTHMARYIASDGFGDNLLSFNRLPPADPQFRRQLEEAAHDDPSLRIFGDAYDKLTTYARGTDPDA
jgi:hypothetical protein